MMYGKSTQNLSVRELEACEAEILAGTLEGESSTQTLETPTLETPTLETPTLETLRQKNSRLEGSLIQHRATRPTLGFGVRLIYFLFVGVWFGFVWLALGVALCLSLIGLPLGILMLRHMDKAFTLW